MQILSQPNYPNPVNIIRERLIFVRFDRTDPSSFNTPIYFPNDDVLKNKVITGIEVYPNFNKFTGSYNLWTDAGYSGEYFSNTELVYFTLTLVGKNNEVLINDLPLSCLVDDNTKGKIRKFSLMADISKSYIRNFGYTGIVNQFSVIPINFYYRNVNEK
jgi:hypothetical protein